jgi:O-antigen ligase
MALSIIRPWEILVPALADLHFERIFAITMLVMVFFSSRNKFQMSLQSWTVLMFIIVLGSTGLAAQNTALAWESWYVIFTVAVVYLVLQLIVRTPHELVFILIWYIVTMAVYLGKAQWEFFVHNSAMFDMGVNRMVGIEKTNGHPNAVAMATVVSMPILLSLWLVRSEISRSWPTLYRKLWAPFLVVYFLVCAISIVLTNSRMGMVSAGLFMGFAVLRRKGIWTKMGPILLGGILLATAWSLMPEDSQNRLRTLWDPGAGPANAYVSVQGRVEGFKAGIEMFDRFPWLGVGIGNFREYRVAYLDGIDLEAHNLLGQLLSETGIIGTAAFALMVLVIFGNISKLIVLARAYAYTDTGKIMASLGEAFRDMILLLLFTGISNHNMDKFQWLWIAAFALIGLRLMQQEASVQYSPAPQIQDREGTGDGLV